MTIVVLVGAVVLFAMAISLVQRHRRSLVPQRGTSIGADLGALSDKPRVRVRSVTQVGPERFHLILLPEIPEPGAAAGAAPSEMDFVVVLRDGEVGFDLLHEWLRSKAPLALVLPPGSRLVRLRSIDDLQPLTLRRADQG